MRVKGSGRRAVLCSIRDGRFRRTTRHASFEFTWMDTCTSVNSISEDFGPCVDDTYFFSKFACLGHRQHVTYGSAKENINFVPVEGINDPQGCLVQMEKLKVEELGISFSGLQIEDFLDQSSGSDLEVPCNNLEKETGGLDDDGQKMHKQDASDVNLRKRLSKSATFPRSEMMQPSFKSVDGVKVISSALLCNQCSLDSGNLVYARSTSLPATRKLVSAMKGGREKEGEPPKTKLKVKWAADVYDPPATSMSHAVRNHHQRPKAKKKDYHKKKHKNKSSRGSTRDKRHVNQTNSGSVTNSVLSSRLQVDGSSSALDVSSIRVMDRAGGGGQESKCGSGLFVGSLSEIHYSVAEAT